MVGTILYLDYNFHQMEKDDNIVLVLRNGEKSLTILQQ